MGSLTEMLLACCSLLRFCGCLIKAALGRFGELNSYVMDFLYLPRSLQLYFLPNFIEDDRTLLLLLYSMGSTLNIVCTVCRRLQKTRLSTVSWLSMRRKLVRETTCQPSRRDHHHSNGQPTNPPDVLHRITSKTTCSPTAAYHIDAPYTILQQSWFGVL